MDQESILKDITLVYSRDLETGVTEDERRVLKHIPRKTFLTVSPTKNRILNRFRLGSTVAEVLRSLIHERECPSLKEFYELVLKAQAQSILVAEGEAPAEERTKALKWPVKIGPKVAQAFLWISIIAAVASLILNGLNVPSLAWELGLGIVLTIISASVGNALAASHLAWARGEIYSPSILWASLVPRLNFDLSDRWLRDSMTSRRMATLKLAPQLFVIGTLPWALPELAYTLFTGLVLITVPLTNSPVSQYVRARFSQRPLSTQSDYLFNPNRALWNLFRPKPDSGRFKFVLTTTAYTAVWLAGVCFINLHIFNLNSELLYQRVFFEYRIVSAIVLTTILTSMFLSGSSGLVLFVRNLHSFTRDRGTKKKQITVQAKRIETSDPNALAQVISSSYLFSHLNLGDEIVDAIAEQAEWVTFKPKNNIIIEGDPGDAFYIIAEGEVNVVKTDSSGRETVTATLGSGEAFGEIALLEERERTRTVRARGRTTLIRIGCAAFNQILVKKAGRDRLRRIMQKEAFLHRLPFTKDWPPKALRAFSELATESTYAKGARMLKRGQDNQFFYIVYEGAFDVKIEKKRIGSVIAGEFMGEISLLQNSVANADVVAAEDSKCLVLHKNDFIRFISEEFIVSLYFERVSSKRLRRPLFPLKGKSLEAYRAP